MMVYVRETAAVVIDAQITSSCPESIYVASQVLSIAPPCCRRGVVVCKCHPLLWKGGDVSQVVELQ
jgi:hypothetical protein